MHILIVFLLFYHFYLLYAINGASPLF